MNQIMGKLRPIVASVPELIILILAIIAAYIIMAVFSNISDTEVLSSTSIFWILFGSFLISTFIAILAAVIGIGGGVIFTPIMMGFTSVDTMIIRATGLVVALFSGLISGGPFFKKGLANMKIVLYGAVPVTIGAMSGGLLAVYEDQMLGNTGDALVCLLLGLIVGSVCFLFIRGGNKTEFPEPKSIDSLSKKLGLNGYYWEESLQKPISYHITRAIPGFLLFFLVGLIGGFFGLGGGWAIVPVLNLVMATPLKVSAACSGVLLGIEGTSAIWPYILYGSLIGIFAVPWMAGQVVGGIIGAHILIKVRVAFVRNLLILILIFTSLKLILKGIEGFTEMDFPV